MSSKTNLNPIEKAYSEELQVFLNNYVNRNVNHKPINSNLYVMRRFRFEL